MRSEDELLDVVYRRSAEIRRRRTTSRLTAGVILVALTAVALVPRLVSDRTEEVPSAHSPVTQAGQPKPTTAACTLPERQHPHHDAPAAGSRPTRSTTTIAAPDVADELAFSSDRSGDWELYTMRADGTGVRRVTNSPGIDREPEWSPDGRQLVFVRLHSQQDFAGDLYIVNADGTGLRHLTSPGEAPTWSPDGRRIAYYSTGPDPATGTVIAQLWVINVDGSGKRLIGKELGDAAWMPDGRGLVVGGQSVSDPVTNVYVIDADGSSSIRLTDDPVYACSPSPSPDGEQIAFVNSAGATFLHLSLMSVDGSNQHPITDGLLADATPTWAPDGRRIAFARDADGDAHWSTPVPGGSAPGSIWLVNPDGTGLVQLTKNQWSDVDPSFRPSRDR